MDWQTDWQERTYALRTALNKATSKPEKSRIIELLTAHRAALRERRAQGPVPPCFTPVSPEYAAARKDRRRADLMPKSSYRDLRAQADEVRRARGEVRRLAQLRVAEELAAIRFRATDQLMRERRAVEVGRPD